MPELQATLPIVHLVPQLPQWLGSVARIAQPVGHVTAPAEHEHVPLVHIPPVPQETPHMPQLFGSVAVSKQPVGHKICVVFVQAQAPAVQVAPVPHRLPHLPQFVGSVCLSTQTPRHTVPASHTTGTHTPLLHACVFEHAALHPPQCARSVAGCTHALPQAISVPVHPPSPVGPVSIALSVPPDASVGFVASAEFCASTRSCASVGFCTSAVEPCVSGEFCASLEPSGLNVCIVPSLEEPPASAAGGVPSDPLHATNAMESRKAEALRPR